MVLFSTFSEIFNIKLENRVEEIAPNIKFYKNMDEKEDEKVNVRLAVLEKNNVRG